MNIERVIAALSGHGKNFQANRWLLASLVAIALLLAGNSAQAQQITGAIAGTVTDSQGAVVPNALIRATNTGTGFSRTATSDNARGYLIQYLPVASTTEAVTTPGIT